MAVKIELELDTVLEWMMVGAHIEAVRPLLDRDVRPVLMRLRSQIHEQLTDEDGVWIDVEESRK